MLDLHPIQELCIWILPILFAVTLHEAAHGWVAFKLGDKTAYMMGRVSANPLKHIDPVGTLIVPIFLKLTTNFIFGWAKPVPVISRNLRHPKRDMALVAAAGPISNFIMALLWGLMAKVGIHLSGTVGQGALLLILMGNAGIWINLFLAILNLLPIPPLDGSRVVSSLLPGKLSYYYDKIEPFGFVILLGLLFMGILTNLIMPPSLFLFRLISALLGLN